MSVFGYRFGLCSTCRDARAGHDLEVTVHTDTGTRTYRLPWYFLRGVDALLEAGRRSDHEVTLLSMNGGRLGTTLCQAATVGGIRDVSLLLTRGALIESATLHMDGTTQKWWTALVWSARGGHTAVVSALLGARTFKLSQVDEALVHAAEHDHLEIVGLLLRPPHGATAQAMRKPLFLSSSAGQLQIVQLLLDSGADRGMENDLAFRMAARGGHLDVVKLLLDRGADVNAYDSYALKAAAKNNHLEIATLLLDRGANREPETDGRTPLSLAAEYGNLEMVRLLLDRGADVDAGDEKDALTMARLGGRTEVVALLLERGAMDLDAKEEEEEEEADEAEADEAETEDDDSFLDGYALEALALSQPHPRRRGAGKE